MIPQITLLFLVAITLLLAANRHGKKKEGEHDFWSVLIALTIELTILYWGGFFDKML